MRKSRGKKTSTTVTLPKEVSYEILQECMRLDRNQAWMLRKIWEIAKYKISTYPSIPKNQEVA